MLLCLLSALYQKACTYISLVIHFQRNYYFLLKNYIKYKIQIQIVCFLKQNTNIIIKTLIQIFINHKCSVLLPGGDSVVQRIDSYQYVQYSPSCWLQLQLPVLVVVVVVVRSLPTTPLQTPSCILTARQLSPTCESEKETLTRCKLK